MTGQRVWRAIVCGVLVTLWPLAAFAQTATYHLHKEASTTSGLFQLQPGNPDGTSLAIQTIQLKNQPVGEYLLKAFDTPSGLPGVAGTIPAGKTFSFTLWMQKSSNFGTLVPRVRVNVNNAAGLLVCQATGSTVLTTSLTSYPLSCTTSAPIALSSTDRLYLWVGVNVTSAPGNHNTTGELDIEGTLNGNYDSRVIVPLPPTITSLSRTSGPAGVAVTITGTNFGTTQGTSTVTFNGTAAAITSWNATTIGTTVPVGATTGPIVITVSGATSAGTTFTVLPIPAITSLTPASAPVNYPVAIAGSNFGATQGTSTVTFNGLAATPTNWSNTSLTVPVPAGATSGPVVVTVNGVASSGAAFTVLPPPGITGVSPTTAHVGDAITITGTNFLATQGTSTVRFNGVLAAPTSWNNTTIVAPVPAGATTGNVVVTVSNQASNGLPLTVIIPGLIGGTITRTAGGAALAGASVQALLTGTVKGSATSAANGTYTIANLDPATYDVRVTASGFAPELRQAIGVTSQNTTTVNVAMAAPGSVTGTVTQSSGGTPIAGAAVTVYAGPTVHGSTNTSGSGSYTISGLHPGSYTLRASSVSYETVEQPLSISEAATTTANLSLDGAVAGSVRYAYDAVGRLIQVTDPAGKSAIYRYDPVGNIVAIERPGTGGAGSLSISGFTPIAGSGGTVVSIFGSGFDTTAANNTVTFNGLAASVATATATQLVVTVPAGATTGPIGVSTSGGSATSGSPFTASASVGGPTITGFTPAIGAIGAALSISGTNFDPIRTNNIVTLNGRVAYVSSATATTIDAAAPPSTLGGRLTVRTVHGVATTTSDFFVPPPPYLASDVVFTDRMTIGSSKTVTIGTAGKVALVLFDGIAGRTVSLQTSNSTFPTNQCSVYTLVVQTHDAAAVTNLTPACNSNTLFSDQVVLPATGTYTIALAASSTATGTLTLSLNDATNVTGPITPNGPAVPIAVANPGQNVALTFNGSAGQLIYADMSSGTLPGCNGSKFSLLGPDLSEITWQFFCSAAALDHITLPVAGTYTLFVDQTGPATGTATIRLYTFTDVTGTITPNGSGVPVTISTPGQNGLLTFSGTAGQLVSVLLSGSTLPGCNGSTFRILQPDGTTVNWGFFCGSSAFLEHVALPVTGTYTIHIDQTGTATGSTTVTLYAFADVTGTITPNGGGVPVTISAPGQNALLTFSGTAGQFVSVLQSGTLPGCSGSTFRILNAAGTTIGWDFFCGGGFLDHVMLPATGTYTLQLDQSGTATGSATLTLYAYADVTGPITANGPSVPVTLVYPGQNVMLTFSGTAGQVVTASVTNGTLPGCGGSTIRILNPSGGTVWWAFECGPGGGSFQTTLPTTQTYTVQLEQSGTATGTATLRLTSP